MDHMSHWSDLYATDLLAWHQTDVGDTSVFYRRQGLVELSFDSDGIDFEGCADLNINIHAHIKTSLDQEELRKRMLLVWAILRHQYLLLAARSLYGEDFLSQGQGRKWTEKYFVYEKPTNLSNALREAEKHITFVEDHYPDLEEKDFYKHLKNTSRVIDDTKTASKLFVLPIRKAASGQFKIQFVLVAGHSISDGITVFRMTNQIISLLNLPEDKLAESLLNICSSELQLEKVLPPAQESLYPPFKGTEARKRWNWAISRILRHVRRPPPASFPNPLRRATPLACAQKMSPTYAQVLDYSRIPPLNTYTVHLSLPPRAVQNIRHLCRTANISLGSGSFTLVAMTMMRFEELLNPHIASEDRLPFVGSFPVNPRPFLSGAPTTGMERSLMLVFSDGVTLPFLPSHLDICKTFRVLGRLVHRQLRQYQKRARSAEEEVMLGSKCPSQLLPSQYLISLDWLEAKVPVEKRVGVNPQGGYPAKQSPTMATCGISSVGDITGIVGPGQYDLNDMEGKDLVVDFEAVRYTVRAREGEFLVGVSGTKEELMLGVSYDGSSIQPEKAEKWKTMMLELFDFDMVVNSLDDQTPNGRDLGANL